MTDLLVAYADDPAGSNMAGYLAEDMDPKSATGGDRLFCGKHFDLVVIPTPAISADWLEDRYGGYDSFVFLSKHAAESGVPALTCHSTGNFSEARSGGRDRQVAIPYPSLQRRYLRALYQNRDLFSGFDITIEATHHGPTALDRPCLFIEVGTTPRQWGDRDLCSAVARIVRDTMVEAVPRTDDVPYAICMGGTHYSKKFTGELLHGRLGLGTVIPKHALEYVDQDMFDHVLQRNTGACAILLDWTGLGRHKRRVEDLARQTGLETIRI